VIYLYAYTNHRADLDSLRRMGALWEILNDAGIDAELLVNDYRAQLAGRELGLPAATTIETIMDIDAVAEHGDRVVIDSPEEAGERMARYVETFARVLRVVPGGGESRYGEAVIDPLAPASLLYRFYGGAERDDERVLIYGDSDWDKMLLSGREAFRECGCSLYWGHYFYVKYEEELAEVFGTIHESDEYPELLSRCGSIVTAMPQTALEAAAAGVRTLYLHHGGYPDTIRRRLASLGIPVLARENAITTPVECSDATGVEIPPVGTEFWLTALGVLQG